MTDSKSLLLDQFAQMICLESVYMVTCCQCPAHLHSSLIDDHSWRHKICQWCFHVVDHLEMDREIVSIALNIFDRFLISEKASNRYESSNDDCDFENAVPSPSCACFHGHQALDSRRYQLAAMTSLYLALKISAVSETSPTLNPTPLIQLKSSHSKRGWPNVKTSRNKRRTLHLEAFVQLSRGQFTTKDVCGMEQVILRELRWLVHPPTPMIFCSYMLAAFMPSTISRTVKRFDMVEHIIQEMSRYVTELAICVERECWGKRPSQIAFCAILTSMNLFTMSALPMSIRKSFYERAIAFLPYNSAKFHEENTQLRAVLQRALWPELLSNELVDPLLLSHFKASNVSGGTEYISKLFHPIAIARKYGFLDMDRIYRGHTNGINVSRHEDKICRGLGVDNQLSKAFRPSPPDSPAGTSNTIICDDRSIVTPTI